MDHTRQGRWHPCVPGALAGLSSRSLEPVRAGRGRRAPEAGAEPVVGGHLRLRGARRDPRLAPGTERPDGERRPPPERHLRRHPRPDDVQRPQLAPRSARRRTGSGDAPRLGRGGNGFLRQPACGERGGLLQQPHLPDPPLLLQARDAGGRRHRRPDLGALRLAGLLHPGEREPPGAPGSGLQPHRAGPGLEDPRALAGRGPRAGPGRPPAHRSAPGVFPTARPE